MLRRAIEHDHDLDARRNDRSQPPDQRRCRGWGRRPPERVKDVRAVDDEAIHAFENAPVVRQGDRSEWS